MSRAMKDSGVEWIGEIPQEWEIRTFKGCIESRDSGAWGEEACGSEGDIICMRIADFDYARFRFKDSPIDDLTVRHYDAAVIEKLQLQIGDVLIEKSGGGEKTPVGRTVIFDKDYPALYANFMDRLRCTEEMIPQWLQYVFVTFYNNGYSRVYIKQTTGIQNLDLASLLANEKLPLPTVPQQSLIAAYLDLHCAEIDRVIEQTRASIEEYKRLKQSIITEAVTHGIRPGRKMKDSGVEWIGEVPEDWECGKAKYFVVLSNGTDPKTEGDIPVYGSGAGSFKTCGEYKKGPTVLLGRKGATLHIPHYIDGLYWNVDTAFDVHALEQFSLRFYYFLACCFDYRFYISQTTLPGMTQTNYENMIIPVPSLDEQREIVAYLDHRCAEIDRLIDAKQQLLTQLEAYKKAVIYEYVTGKREVPA